MKNTRFWFKNRDKELHLAVKPVGGYQAPRLFGEQGRHRDSSVPSTVPS